MSTPPPPPERPTRPLRAGYPVTPAAPVAAAATVPVDPAYAVAVDPDALLVRLDEAVRSLRTWVAVLGLISALALGIAIYAALRDPNAQNGSRNGQVSDARVSSLNDRVDRLSGQVKSLRARTGATSGASAGDAAALNTRIDALDRSVKTLAARPSGAGSGDTPAISQLSSRVDSLSREVAALKQSQPSSSGSTP